jgi:hypothetical protein
MLRPLQLEDPSQSELMYSYAPADGFRIVTVEIKVANLGASVIHYDEFNIHLVDADGFVYGV